MLEEAKCILRDNHASFSQALNKKLKELEALKKPKFRDGTLGIAFDPDMSTVHTGIMTYADFKKKNLAKNYTFGPLPLETILRHLAPDGDVQWEYNDENSIFFEDRMGNTIESSSGQCLSVPAPYREDWQNVGGNL